MNDHWGSRLRSMSEPLPLLYEELAGWFHVLSPPAEYADEARVFRDVIHQVLPAPPRRLLELGSGAGCNAFHLKRDFICTLSDLSPGMIEASRQINPECEHLVGDMRTLRLERQFDCVFVHDAIMYMTTEQDLQRAIETAFVHCRPGGAALLAPDWTKETFSPRTDHGGSDADGRSLRYLEWCWDPDPDDTTYLADYVYVLRERGTDVRVVHDRHLEGLFPRDTWRRVIEQAGFRIRDMRGADADEEIGEIILAVRA
jgi:SAM-dependent methyltransferase